MKNNNNNNDNVNNIIINNINNNNNNENDKENLMKINILKKGLLEERKKNSDLNNEIIKLKEENVIYKEKNMKLKSKIEKLSKEINEYKNNNNNNGNINYVGKFFTNFFEDNNNNSENEEEENSNDSNTNSNLINSLQNQISILSNEKKILSNKIEEINTKFIKIKEDYENLLTNLKNDFAIKEKKYLNEISEKTIRIESLTEFVKNFENEKNSYENSITKKNETLKEIIKNQEKIFNDLENKNSLIKNLNYQINEYKKIIEQLTPINNTLDFEGYKILNKNNEKIKVIFNFSKNKNKITYKEQNKKEIIFTTKELINMNQDKNNKNIIYMEFYLNKIKYNFQYLFQNERDCEYILKFYKEIKKPGIIQNTLFNLSLNDYFY